MPLFTVIADYDGGTYVAQTTAPNVQQAALRWARQFDINIIPGLGKSSKEKMIAAFTQGLHEDRPVPLDGVANVWCTSVLLRGKGMLLNIVETSA